MSQWVRKRLDVPVSRLEVDPAVGPSPKGYARHDMREWMRCVPELYRLRAEGHGPAEFARMRTQPRNRREQLLGDTHARVFESSTAPLRADLTGDALRVQAGHHRVQAAREAGVPVLPVSVAAADAARLRQLERECQRERARLPDHTPHRDDEPSTSRGRRPLAPNRQSQRDRPPHRDR